jgi:hypothetical protein
MTYAWKNENNAGGRIEVGEKGALAIHVEDDHYSGELDWEAALGLAGNIFSALLQSTPPTDNTTDEQKKAMWAVLRTAPTDLPVIGDDAHYVLNDERTLELARSLRDLIVNSIIRLGFSGMGAMPVLLELAVSLGGKELRAETFMQNAEHWYRSVRLATPNAPALQPGGVA